MDERWAALVERRLAFGVTIMQFHHLSFCAVGVAPSHWDCGTGRAAPFTQEDARHLLTGGPLDKCESLWAWAEVGTMRPFEMPSDYDVLWVHATYTMYIFVYS